MKNRFKIEVNMNGVAIWDTVNKIYIFDASTIQKDLTFTMPKRVVKRLRLPKWETGIEYKIIDCKNIYKKEGE